MNKLRELASDVLIALSARGVGVTLITCNRKDFAEIGKWITFKVVFGRPPDTRLPLVWVA